VFFLLFIEGHTAMTATFVTTAGNVTLTATAENLAEDSSRLLMMKISADLAIEIPGSLAWYATVQRQRPVCNTQRVPFPVSGLSR
jgi:hypothetical protein